MRYDPDFLLMSVVASASDVAQSVKLREAIKEYEANKWKVIGQKVGKPAKVSIGISYMSLCMSSNLRYFPIGLRTVCQRAFQERLTTTTPLTK